MSLRRLSSFNNFLELTLIHAFSNVARSLFIALPEIVHLSLIVFERPIAVRIISLSFVKVSECEWLPLLSPHVAEHVLGILSLSNLVVDFRNFGLNLSVSIAISPGPSPTSTDPIKSVMLSNPDISNCICLRFPNFSIGVLDNLLEYLHIFHRV